MPKYQVLKRAVKPLQYNDFSLNSNRVTHKTAKCKTASITELSTSQIESFNNA